MRTPPESELKGGVSGALWMRRRKPRGKDAMRAQVVPTQGFPMQPRLIAFGNPRRTSIAAKAASASKMKATQIMIIELRRRLAFATGRLCSCRRHRRSDHQRRHRGGDSLGRSRVFQKGLRPTSEPERQANATISILRTVPYHCVSSGRMDGCATCCELKASAKRSADSSGS
jgi:hypothetical protein